MLIRRGIYIISGKHSKFLIKKDTRFYYYWHNDKYTELLKSLGCNVITIPLNRRSINPIIEFKTLINYSQFYKSHIDVLLNFTPKITSMGALCSVPDEMYK